MNDDLPPLDPQLALAVRDLSVAYRTDRGPVGVVRGVSFDLRRGEALALIGESGAGKTTLGLSLVRLLPAGARVGGGQVLYRATHSPQTVDVLRLAPEQLRRFRWRECALVVQAALNALNPVLRVCDHFADTARAHRYLAGRALAARGAELLRMVRLDPDRVWRAYPHQLSGGMRQRVLIALSLLLTPGLLILDEPTTALDTLTQRTVIDVLKELRQAFGFAMVVISHDLALAAELADRVATLYAGAIVEIGDRRTVLTAPAHPYTVGLLRALPTLAARPERLASIPGTPPNPAELPRGCAFHPRCPLASEQCRRAAPALEPIGDGVQVACWHWRSARATCATARNEAQR
jgi:peptide/nickel transport system ATP-binding protein